MAPAQWTDRWTRGVLPLGALHLTLALVLRSRPGALGPPLFKWGPLVLLVVAALLLAAALWSAIRGRERATLRSGAGLLGMFAIVATILAEYRAYPSSYDSTPSAIAFRLPLDGPVRVAWGGPTLAVNYHARSPGERWGYDLLVTENGLTYLTDGRAPSDYHVYGRPVAAPAGGRVVRVRDGVPDAVPGRADRRRGPGNYVVLEVAPSEYLFLAHLRAGSVRVAPGETVRRGDVLGEVGNSGNSSEPHLHLHLQDTPEGDSGEGIPLRFPGARLLGSDPPIYRPIPEGGMRGGRYVGDVVVDDGSSVVDIEMSGAGAVGTGITMCPALQTSNI